MPFLKKVDTLICRREGYGGMVFDGKRGITLELDKEAYRLLEMSNGYFDRIQIQKVLSDELKKDFTEIELNRLIRKLIGVRILYESHEQDSSDTEIASFDHWPSGDYLTAPETVLWAATYRCNLNCRYCYVKRDLSEEEMDFNEVKQFIDILERNKVFQLAIGGGEPFLRSDLPDIVDYAYRKRIVFNITTNGICLERGVLNKIRDKIGRLQISFDQSDIVELNRGRDLFDEVKTSIELVKEMEVPFGINVIITKSTIDNIEEVVSFLYNLGTTQISFLRAKPSYCNFDWCQDETPTNEQYHRLKEKLNYLAYQYCVIKFHIDCALSFFMKDIPVQRLRFHGVYGCRAGERFITVLPNGDMYPCSHFTNGNNRIGNILKDDFYHLWHNSSILRKFRTFRKNLLFKKTNCGRCKVNEHCGGCRVIAKTSTDNFYQADPDCF